VVQAQHDFQRVPTRALAAFGASGLAQNIVGRVHLFIFYTDAVGLAPLWISAALFVATLWDAVFGIAMGHTSDRTRWKWGRRRPYVLLGALPFGLTFEGVLWPPARLGGAVLGGYLAALLPLQFSAANVVHVPVLGLIPEMAQSYHERTRMAAWREALGNVGDLVGLLLPFVLCAALTSGDTNAAADALVSRTAYGITGPVGGALAPYPFWVAIAQSRGKAFAFRCGLAVSSLAFVSVFALQPGALAMLVFVMIFSGAANVRFWTLLYTLNADIAELDELETGERREGIFAGFAALLRKCAFAIAAGFVGIGLDLFGYQPHVGQTASALLGIKLLFPMPTTLLVIATWFAFRRFPLTPERCAEIAVRLDARRTRDGAS